MKRISPSDRFTSRQHRGMVLIAYLLLFPYLSRHYPAYARWYFILQIPVVQGLALFQEYLDTWSVLYILLGIQVVYTFSRKEALIWGSLLIGLTLVTLGIEFGLLSGLGRAGAYILVGVFLISYDIQYARREEAQAESQLLLEEFQSAHLKLKDHAIQAEKLAAAQERSRITREIHDSVGQKVFAIQLMAESTCLFLKSEPERAGEQLDLLQAQTQAALGQMRELIAQWRQEAIAPPS
jgi:signal transduction histidine kinase